MLWGGLELESRELILGETPLGSNHAERALYNLLQFSTAYPGGLTMARIRIILEDDHGHEINGDKERLYDLSGGTKRLVDIEAAVEGLKQVALPELMAELLTVAQHQFVTEVKKGASCVVMEHG